MQPDEPIRAVVFDMDGLMGLLPGIGDLAAMANKRNRRLMIEHLERGEL